MAIKPKLEFFRIKLNPTDETFKTFRDFALDELYEHRISNDIHIMNKLFDYFMNQLVTEKAKVNKLRKQIKLIKTSSNIHLIHKPKVDLTNHTISGVINGGRYGRNGMMGDVAANSEEASSFGQNKVILQYYYFLLYLPLDHNEGCLIIHSNSKEETITDVFVTYLERIFKGVLYKKTIINRFCPSSFQDEFKDGAIIKTVKFQNTFLDNIFTADGITTENTEYDVQISITPKGNNVPINSISSLNRLINALSFKRRTTTNLLSSFNSRKMILRSPISNSEKVFEMDDEMTDFVPVVYLDGRINDYNDDETPNFNSLDLLCKNYLRDEVLQEIRLDLSI